jgi:hypothetical protein
VRVHTDARAAESAHAVDAQAYTVGQHIAFAAGRHAPATAEGRLLLAHELTHVLQQNFQDPPTGTLTVAASDDAHERQARAAEQQIAAGRTPVSVDSAATAVRIQRQEGSGDCVCGPNVTAQTREVLGRTALIFQYMPDEVKGQQCRALGDPAVAINAWDITELHFHKWLANYNPPCATACSTGHTCEASVQIDNSCFYAGSVNYVLFGLLCRLCYDYYDADYSAVLGFIDWPQDRDAYSEDAMIELIWIYKGAHPRLSVHWGSSGDYEASKDWARAGYHWWSLMSPWGQTPAGDRAECSTTCSQVYGSVSGKDADGGTSPRVLFTFTGSRTSRSTARGGQHALQTGPVRCLAAQAERARLMFSSSLSGCE